MFPTTQFSLPVQTQTQTLSRAPLRFRFQCAFGVIGRAPQFFAPSPVNATLDTARGGQELLILPFANPERLIGLPVIACGVRTGEGLFVTNLVPAFSFGFPFFGKQAQAPVLQ